MKFKKGDLVREVGSELSELDELVVTDMIEADKTICVYSNRKGFAVWAKENAYELRSPAMDTTKDTTGKLPLTLVPVSLVPAVAAVRQFAQTKYPTANQWQKVDPQKWKDALLAC